MIVQEGVEIIVMLCNVVEKDMPKCAQYFPSQVGEIMKVKEVEIKNSGVSFSEIF